MSTARAFGLALLAAGAILLYFGWQSTESMGEKLIEGVTGRYSDGTMGYLIGGAVAAIVGIGLMLSGKRR